MKLHATDNYKLQKLIFTDVVTPSASVVYIVGTKDIIPTVNKSIYYSALSLIVNRQRIV